MTLRDLEFSISQYADGTLPADQREALEAVLAAHAGARELLEAYRKLDAALAQDRAARPLAVRWDGLAAQVSSHVARHAESAQPVAEELESAIAGYADGSLPAGEREAVEAALGANPACRLLLADYAALDTLLKGALPPVPEVRWDALQAKISDAIAAHDDASAAGDLPEELEFQIAQYADGTLAAAEREAVERVLAEQPAARLLLAEYASLGQAMEAAKGEALPAVRWDRLAGEISAAIAREAEESEQPAVAGKIGPAERAASYPMFGWLRSPMRLAAAASVLLAVGVGLTLMRRTGGPVVPPVDKPPVLAAVADVVVAGAEPPKGEVVEDIAIGPPAGRAEFASGFTDDMISRPSRSYVSSGAPPAPRGDDVAVYAWPQ